MSIRAKNTLEPGTHVGRWRVVKPLGEGGQGAVYLVEDAECPGHFCAFKLARQAHDGRAVREVILMEVRAVHPHVVRFHDRVPVPPPYEDRPGFIMDWVSGVALDAWAERESTTLRQFAETSAIVASTLGELHARGVLHRDLKPDHILVRESDGQPMLLDFGVGWYEGATPLTTGLLPPVTRYLLSPEAVRFLWEGPQHPGAHHIFSPSDDLYAMGVCLYRAVTGHYPFSEWLPVDMLQYAILHLRVPTPVEVNPRVPRPLSDIILRLLAKDPSERYSSGADVHTALVDALSLELEQWDVPIFNWENLLPETEGDLPERRILWPERPPPAWTSGSTRSLARPAPDNKRRGYGPQRLAFALVAFLAMVPITLARWDPTVAGAWMTDAQVDAAFPSTDVPPVPGKNQKRGPCATKLEVEIAGACWLSLKQRPPDCPPPTSAYADQCLWPVPKPAPVTPTSVDGGMSKEP